MKVLKPVNWIGTKAEFSNFIYQLDSHSPKNKSEILFAASKCFTFNNDKIEPSKLSNNKRKIKVKRKQWIDMAIQHLYPQKPTSK